MAEPDVGVTPYWELTFDADGDVNGKQRDRLLQQARERGVHDLLVFAHGWNNDRSIATRLYSRFFEPIPGLAPTAHLGYVGVMWPSMRFTDEPIPDFERSVIPAAPGRPRLDKGTRRALVEVFPGRATVIDQISELLDEQPDDDASLAEYGRLVRLLVEAPAEGPQAAFAEDTFTEGPEGTAGTAGKPRSEPEMLSGDTAEMCRAFARALADTAHDGEGAPAAPGPGGAEAAFRLPRLWDGAHELLRQATYYAMKRRAGTVGERGLGRTLGQLAHTAPDLRVHLAGHSFGARLVSFALRGLPEGVRTVKSVTLLQGAFSHYAFATRLPHNTRGKGALHGQQSRIDGPLVCCFSRFDSALGTLYPLASRMAGDDSSAAGVGLPRLLSAKWGALGHNGIQAVDGTKKLKLAEALRTKLPTSGFVNIDAASVVKRGGPPSGAHSDICHRELAQVVLAAGRVR
ncbi:serine-threonine protein kinase [Streptomyces sporangiiformans]|uniref:Serine-threonine protein kinase n=1 Tax=Streptomyces sporangiiformans TaxID=2315329 RepID=A0A505D7D7_9ACTN|nr:serine-threonine protein kinase [Streptomyces sporangiiformans]TPQ16628.1 serine-threonine protein kinase [Streptomyces sporangiiformans]